MKSSASLESVLELLGEIIAQLSEESLYSLLGCARGLLRGQTENS